MRFLHLSTQLGVLGLRFFFQQSLAEALRTEVFGFGHLGVPGKKFYGPSAGLLARRKAAQLEPTTGLPYGAFNPPTGQPLTHLVRATCRCGSVTMVTPERADGARCSGCLHTDVLEKGTSRA